MRTNGEVSPGTIISRTWSLPKNFGAAMSGPSLRYVQIWTIRNDRFVVGKVYLVKNALAELDRLVGLAVKGQKRAFDASVPPSISKKLWTMLRLKSEFYGVGITGTTDGNTFQLEDPKVDWVVKATVTFEKRNGRWQAASLTDK